VTRGRKNRGMHGGAPNTNHQSLPSRVAAITRLPPIPLALYHRTLHYRNTNKTDDGDCFSGSNSFNGDSFDDDDHFDGDDGLFNDDEDDLLMAMKMKR